MDSCSLPSSEVIRAGFFFFFQHGRHKGGQWWAIGRHIACLRLQRASIGSGVAFQRGQGYGKRQVLKTRAHQRNRLCRFIIHFATRIFSLATWSREGLGVYRGMNCGASMIMGSFGFASELIQGRIRVWVWDGFVGLHFCIAVGGVISRQRVTGTTAALICSYDIWRLVD